MSGIEENITKKRIETGEIKPGMKVLDLAQVMKERMLKQGMISDYSDLELKTLGENLKKNA